MSDAGVVTILTEAKAELLEHGWTQGKRRNSNGERCVIGALFEVGGAKTGALELLSEVAGMHIGCWNDLQGRTFNEVMEVFDEAIRRAKEQAA